MVHDDRDENDGDDSDDEWLIMIVKTC